MADLAESFLTAEKVVEDGKPGRTKALIERGVMTPRQALFAGFPLPKDLEDEARKAPMCEVERKKHIRVMACLWHVPEDEARAKLEGEGRIPTEEMARELEQAGANIDARNQAVKKRGRGA